MENLQFKKVHFNLNQSIYKWGKGWIVSADEANQFDFEIKQLIEKLGLITQLDKIVEAASETGINAIGESIYFHPMSFVGYIRQDNISKYKEIINSFNSKFWSLGSVSEYELQPYSNQSNYVGNILRNIETYNKQMFGNIK
jgi:hypothetical protein